MSRMREWARYFRRGPWENGAVALIGWVLRLFRSAAMPVTSLLGG